MKKEKEAPRANKEEQIKELLNKRANDLFQRPNTDSLDAEKVNKLAEEIAKL